MTFSLKGLSVVVLAAAMFSFGAGTPFGPDAALAQTATKLKCKKCVNGKAIKNGAVKFNRLQGKVQDRITNLESAMMERVPFYVTLDTDGAEQTLATNGTLEIFARCRVNNPIGQDIIDIVATSSAAGWFLSNQGGPFAAGQEVILISRSTAIATTLYNNNIDGRSVVAPDGSYLAIDYETTGHGLNIFGHECFTVGNVFVISGTP